jgi:hypothetical protein
VKKLCTNGTVDSIAELAGVPSGNDPFRGFVEHDAVVGDEENARELMRDDADCEKRARNEPIAANATPRYGNSFGVTVRFRSNGEPPVLRLLWSKRDGAWKISVYDEEMP